MDSHGRVFYIDHKNHTTTWQKPRVTNVRSAMASSGVAGAGFSGVAGAGGSRDAGKGREGEEDSGAASGGSSAGMADQGYQQERQRLDQRYQRVHRAIALASVSSEADVDGGGLAGAVGAASAPAPMLISAEKQREMLVNGPVVRFITRPDFVTRAQLLDHPAALLLNRASVRHMISKVRRDANNFERYQHNRDLVSLLNAFARKDRELPPGWESKKDKNGKVRQKFPLKHKLLYIYYIPKIIILRTLNISRV
jgi:E3 ubiquitin-protein ligase HECW1